MASQPTTQPPSSPDTRSWSSLFRRLIGGFGVLAVLMIPVARWLTYEQDHALSNVLTMMLLSVFAMCLIAWLVLAPRIGLARRIMILAVPTVSVAIFMSWFEFRGFTGEMLPIFKQRRESSSGSRSDAIVEGKPSNVEGTDQTRNGEVASTPTANRTPFSQLLGNARDGSIEGVELETDWVSNKPQILWKQPVGAGWSGIAIQEDRLVTIEQHDKEEWVSCRSLASGKLLWKYAYAAYHYNVLGGLGPRSTPTIDGNRVYTQGASGILLCLDLVKGDLIWKQDLLALVEWTQAESEALIAWGRSASPLVDGDRLIVPLGGPASLKNRALICFDKANGKEIWRVGSDQISYSSPTIKSWGGIRCLVMVNEKTLTGHSPIDGAVQWELPWPGTSNADASASEPLQVDDRRLLISKGYGEGAMMVELTPGGDGRLQARKLWSQKSQLRTKFTSAVVFQGHAYALSDGILECVELEQGKRTWKKGRYGHGQVLRIGRHLLIASEEGELVLVDARPEQFNELAKLSVITGTTWNIPAFSDDLVIIRNGQEMACVKVPLKKAETTSVPTSTVQ